MSMLQFKSNDVETKHSAEYERRKVELLKELADLDTAIQASEYENTTTTCSLGAECLTAQGEPGVCCEINGELVCDPSESCDTPTCNLGSECQNAQGEPGVCCEIDGKPVCDPSESCDTPTCNLGSECQNAQGEPGVCCEIDGKPVCDP